MARTKNIVDEEKLAHLKKMVEAKFGRTITTSKDCSDLAQALTTLESVDNINPQTIRRLYGLVQTNHSPSVYTLDLLSKYVANTNWRSYKVESEVNSDLKLLADWIFDFYSLQNFGNTKIVDAIAESNDLQNLLLMRLATIPSAREMFFETRPLRDCLSKNYKNVLPVYVQSKQDNEAKLFGYGMLFLGAFLTENNDDIEKYYQLIKTTPLTKEVFNIPAGRKYGVPLMYYHLLGDEKSFINCFHKALQKRQDYVSLSNYNWDSCTFDLVLAEHLLLIGRFAECRQLWVLHLLDLKTRKHKRPTLPHFKQINILLDAYTSTKAKENKLIDRFDTNQLRLGERKFYTFFFILYQLNHTSKTAKQKRLKLTNQLDSLIADTGYTWFKNLVQN